MRKNRALAAHCILSSIMNEELLSAKKPKEDAHQTKKKA
jgi:hypothetical protein